jgi:hypothetical protein
VASLDADDAVGGLFGAKEEEASEYWRATPEGRRSQGAPTTRARDTSESSPAPTEAIAAATGSAQAVPSWRAAAWAVSVPPPSTTGVDADLLNRVRTLDGQAEVLAGQGQYREAALVLMPAVAPPAAIGQWYASRIGAWYLLAGEDQAAADVAALGLGLGGATPQSPALLRVYGDSLQRLGRVDEAERAWQLAAGM